MSSVVRPRGPLPPKVYWRRRLVVLGLLLLVIVVIVIIVIPRGGGATPSPTSSGATPGATPTPSATAGGACDPTRVELTADSDKTEYAAGELPQLWITLENKTSQPCTVRIGGADLAYVITSPSGSGDEQYWSTADCATTEEAQAVTVTLKPGVPVSNEILSWPRARSTPGDCVATAPQIGAEGASFDFTASFDGLTATKRFYLY